MNREDSNLKKERTVIWENGEYSYPMAYGFVPNLVAYLHEDEKERPCMLVVPGAHLCASVCVHYEDVEEKNAAYMGLSNRPDAAILSYPVITSGEKAHRDSFTALLGADATEAELAYYSLETQVSGHTPPCFVWSQLAEAWLETIWGA
jgi:hypothetical protein